MNPSKYTYFSDFTEEIVVSEMWKIIKTHRELRMKYRESYDANVIKAAIAILRYYS